MNKLEEFESLLVISHKNEINDYKRIADILHDKLQGDLIAIKNFVFIYSQLENENDKKEMLSNVQLTLDASIMNTRKLSHQLMPPFLDKGDFIKAVEYYFDSNSKSTGIQFLVEVGVPSFTLSEDKAYELFRIVQMFCDYSIQKGSATRFTLLLNIGEIEIIDNGSQFAINLESQFSSEDIFLSLPLRLKVIGGKLKQQIVDEGNHFVLKIINN